MCKFTVTYCLDTKSLWVVVAYTCLHMVLKKYSLPHLAPYLINFLCNLPLLPFIPIFIYLPFYFYLFFCWSCSYWLAALCWSWERWVGGAWAFYDPSSSSFHPVKCLTTINLNCPPYEITSTMRLVLICEEASRWSLVIPQASPTRKPHQQKKDTDFQRIELPRSHNLY